VISLEGKVAVVTGASRGIGAAVARQLADQGVKLGLASRSGDDLGISDAVARPTDVRDRSTGLHEFGKLPPSINDRRYEKWNTEHCRRHAPFKIPGCKTERDLRRFPQQCSESIP